jgi:hypothetical protein
MTNKADERELATLHGEIARGLTGIIKDGAVVGDDGEGGVIRASASAAFYMAGITFLKNNNITADAGTNKELDDLTKALQERRQAAKGKMTRTTVQEVAAHFERELGAGFDA